MEEDCSKAGDGRETKDHREVAADRSYVSFEETKGVPIWAQGTQNPNLVMAGTRHAARHVLYFFCGLA